MTNLKYKDLPKIKEELMRKQGNRCPICLRDLSRLKKRDRCLDHNHKTGKIRAVLCRGCNSMEGKVYKAFQRVGLAKAKVDYHYFLIGLSIYADIEPETEYIHPKHRGNK